jgi:hypothetical protein
MRARCKRHRLLVDRGIDLCWDHMPGASGRVLGVVVVKAAVGGDLGHRERSFPHNGDSKFRAGYKPLNHDAFAEAPFGSQRREVVAVSDDAYADARTFVERLEDVRPRQGIAGVKSLATNNHMLCHRYAGMLEDQLCLRLVHRQRGCKKPGMGVWDCQDIEEPLNRAVLTPTTVQSVEDDVRSRCQPRQQVDRIASDVDHTHVVAGLRQRLRYGGATDKRNLPLRGPAAHQHGDTLAHCASSRRPPSAGTPTQ